MDLVYGMPLWQWLLILSVILTYTLVAGGWVLAKAGRSPLWVLVLMVPYLNVIAIWAFAYARWPYVDGVAQPAPRVEHTEDEPEA